MRRRRTERPGNPRRLPVRRRFRGHGHFRYRRRGFLSAADLPKYLAFLRKTHRLLYGAALEGAQDFRKVASIAASLIAGSGTFGYLWSRHTNSANCRRKPPSKKPQSGRTIALARDLMGKGEHVGAMRELGAAIGRGTRSVVGRGAFPPCRSGIPVAPSNPNEVDVETVLKTSRT